VLTEILKLTTSALADIVAAMINIQQLANQFKVFSEPVRLRILHLLLESGELCVCDLMQSLQLTQSVVSRHLAYLKKQQFINDRRDGLWVFYKINPTQPSIIKQLLENYQTYASNSIELKRDLEQLSVKKNVCS